MKKVVKIKKIKIEIQIPKMIRIHVVKYAIRFQQNVMGKKMNLVILVNTYVQKYAILEVATNVKKQSSNIAYVTPKNDQ